MRSERGRGRFNKAGTDFDKQSTNTVKPESNSDQLPITTTSLQWPSFWGPIFHLYYFNRPLNDDHLSTMATIMVPKGGRCTQVWLNMHIEENMLLSLTNIWTNFNAFSGNSCCVRALFWWNFVKNELVKVALRPFSQKKGQFHQHSSMLLCSKRL